MAPGPVAPVLPGPPSPLGGPTLISLAAEPQEVIGVAPDALPGRAGDPITGIVAVRAVGGTVVRLYDAGTGRMRREVRLPSEVLPNVTPAISPDGKWLAVALDNDKLTGDGLVGFFSTFQKPVYNFFLRSPGLRDSVGFAFSPDGTRLAVANKNSYVQLWNLGTRERLTTVKGSYPPEGLFFSTDGSTFMPRFRGQKQTTLIETATGRTLTTLPLPQADLMPGGLLVAPGGRTVQVPGGTPLPLPAYLAGGAVTAGFDRTAGRVLVTLPLPTQPNVTTLELREVMTGTVLARHVLPDVESVRLMPDGEHALLRDGAGGLRLLTLR